jgi:hypothetical protein
MLWVGMGMMPSNAKATTRDDLNNVGGYAGLMTATPSDASADEMVPGDIATAKAFGERMWWRASLAERSVKVCSGAAHADAPVRQQRGAHRLVEADRRAFQSSTLHSKRPQPRATASAPRCGRHCAARTGLPVQPGPAGRC